jgi:hypothetical protein
MQVVLGLDAGWTADEPSGIALVANGFSGWRLIAAEASYLNLMLALAAQNLAALAGRGPECLLCLRPPSNCAPTPIS